MGKNLARLTALCLCLSMSCTLTAMAAEEKTEKTDPNQAYAQRLADLGVFQGTGNGFELEKTPTRAEGVTMLVRLMGGEAEAQTMGDTELPFTDVADWARGYAAYAWTGGLTKGTGETTFGSDTLIDAEMYTTFLLRCLSYSDSGEEADFQYADSVTYAASIGLFDEALTQELAGAVFTRGQVAHMSCAALEFLCKDTSQTLLDKLVADKKLDEKAAKKFRESPAVSGGGGGVIDSNDDVPMDFPTTFYETANWAPDFGAKTGARLTKQESDTEHGIHCFYYLDYKVSDVVLYRDLLQEYGFVYDETLAERLPDFDTPEAYVNAKTDHCIVLDTDSKSGEFMIYTY